MKRLKTLLCMTLLMGLGTGVSAQSLPECSCDFDGGVDFRNGAEVSNASACYLTHDRNTNWCRFTVDGLLGSQALAGRLSAWRDIIKSGGQDAFAAIVSEQMGNYVLRSETTDTLERRFGANSEDVAGQITDRIAENSIGLFECATAYDSGDPDRQFAEMVPLGAFSCGIHPETGWLNLMFQFDGWRLFYLVSPQ